MAKNLRDFSSEADIAAYAQTNPDARVVCPFCDGNGCSNCSDGERPAWIYDPNITGHPHERHGRN